MCTVCVCVGYNNCAASLFKLLTLDFPTLQHSTYGCRRVAGLLLLRHNLQRIFVCICRIFRLSSMQFSCFDSKHDGNGYPIIQYFCALSLAFQPFGVVIVVVKEKKILPKSAINLHENSLSSVLFLNQYLDKFISRSAIVSLVRENCVFRCLFPLFLSLLLLFLPLISFTRSLPLQLALSLPHSHFYSRALSLSFSPSSLPHASMPTHIACLRSPDST